ncbi:Signal transducer regulating beta-lactamase production, contains metallopeptidase domain [Dyadobacter koreensis]|uniref:Signal transducer regulating beta-lactamase production, contains metallopeptidase domain n=1 Tax=Dyadobacter koreensis TaxID=408657 RepID=A0A1H6TEK9_9BACT|nr:M56 family metallopeptidase [Dyadobacter koreensis]SEI74675.1 Signal transducer regulating beta-lactamase production, contains metallopeptidase domain [Dyadobacter koreensis]
MTSYIIKFVICSGILLLFYHQLLEKENTYRFNRFYLLFSIMFSLAIPLISVKTVQNDAIAQVYKQVPIEVLDKPEKSTAFVPEENSVKSTDWLVLVYSLVAAFLLARFIRNLYSVLIKKHRNEIVHYRKAKFILLSENAVTYTFFNYVFVSSSDFYNKEIEEEILTHELAHVQQKHTFDIIFIELIIIFFWFNPFVFLFKKAIMLNHEFLADEAVLLKYQDPKTYKLLLLDKILYRHHVGLTSSFNYSITKKRLAMMTKKTSQTAAIIKTIALIPTLAILTFALITKVTAQQPNAKSELTKPAFNNSGVSQEHFDEYQNTLKRGTRLGTSKYGKPRTFYDLEIIDVRRMDIIYRSMNTTQQALATKVFFIPMSPPTDPEPPTEQQLNDWKDGKKYGVWVDGKRISNQKLTHYAAADFAHFSLSKLEKNAINYGKHYFQIDLSTPEYFKKWHDAQIPYESIPKK